MVEDSKEERIRGVLNALHLCKQCVTRVFNHSFIFYTLNDVDDRKTPSHCRACLGILEEPYLFTVAREIARRLEECDSSTFQIGVSLPQCLILRHASLRAYINSEYTSITTVKSVVKVLLTNLVEKLTKMKWDPQGKPVVQVEFEFPGNEVEFNNVLAHLRESTGQVVTFKDIQKELRMLTDAEIKMHIACPPQPVETPCSFNAIVRQASVVFGGRYNKYSRELFQTPRSLDGIRIGETSVMELIGEKLKQFAGGEKMKIKTVGHEASDIRILGDGRPFALEVTDPKRTVVTAEQLAQLEIDINSSTQLIAVRDLKIVDKASVKFTPDYREEEITYKAKLWSPVYISDGVLEQCGEVKDLVIKQNTPISILNSGCASKTEIRKICEMSLKRLDEAEHYEAIFKSQGGTYIKEFVHGDLGRTEPSLLSLLNIPIDIK